ncbi:hypothetical protein VNO77_24767 [Canavalia gladiata]|uniref:Protein-L-isoaspartate O-methyltransferase n=1 Tax=Canavalia gladiata TaxID=3824 RepID=A0AAN9QCX6_CANGL
MVLDAMTRKTVSVPVPFNISVCFKSQICVIITVLSPNPNSLTENPIFSRMEQFWSGSAINENKGMVDNLQRYGIISSRKVAEVMQTIDRALFVNNGSPPYVDTRMPIGYNVYIPAPHMHAICLQLLEEKLQPGMLALDVGSGTGYLTACFALMVGPLGRAIGVEHIPELVSFSIESIQKSAAAEPLKNGSLSVHVGDGRQGWPEFAPYDAIHVGAVASEIPQPFIDQLKAGGRMVIPVGNIYQDLKVVDKNSDGSISIRTETSVRYVPLTSREAQLRGNRKRVIVVRGEGCGANFVLFSLYQNKTGCGVKRWSP